MTYFPKYPVILLLSLITALLYNYTYLNRAHVEIRIQSPKNTFFTMYWATTGEQSYSATKRARVRIRPNTERYKFSLTDLRDIDSIRIDPSGVKGKVTVKEITIRQPGLPTIQLSNAEDFARLRPFGDVDSTVFSDNGWVVTSTGSQPRFQLLLPQTPRTLNWVAEIGHFLFLLIPLLLLVRFLEPLWPNYIYVPACGVFVLGLILTMAVVSQENRHPDESVHISAVEYYETHWLPPAVESDEIKHTYSRYGFSRLNTVEVSYFFAGKFVKFLEIFQLNHVIALRLFNVTLFVILLSLAIKNSSYRLMFIPLLLSPQIWYIFSYTNSDAFALFVSILAGWQMVASKSAVNRFLKQQKVPFLKLLGIGLLFALLILIKKNFYFFTLFLLFYFLWRCIFYPFPNLKNVLKKLAIICCIGGVFVGIRLGADLSVNGFNKGEKMRNMQEIASEQNFKPSTELHKKHFSLQMRERGTNLKSFIQDHRWGEKTFRSGFGAYGYLTVSGSLIYYNIMRTVAITGLIFMALSIAIRGGWSGNILFLGTLLCSTALIGVACYHAWTVDFQGQGRYLFAMVAMLGVVLVKTEKVYNQRLLTTLVASMFLLSVYSFIGTALLGIAKHGWG
jgi:hypothetical protein